MICKNKLERLSLTKYISPFSKASYLIGEVNCDKENIHFSVIKAADLNLSEEGGQLYWASPFNKDSLAEHTVNVASVSAKNFCQCGEEEKSHRHLLLLRRYRRLRVLLGQQPCAWLLRRLRRRRGSCVTGRRSWRRCFTGDDIIQLYLLRHTTLWK